MSDQSEISPASPLLPEKIYRHPLSVRIWHWINALCLVILLMSGLAIFNAHPRLYIGHTGYFDTPAVMEITGNKSTDDPQSWVQIGSTRWPVTGLLGVPEQTAHGRQNVAFPSWMRLPQVNNLALARGWHFMMAWFLLFSCVGYVAYLVLGGRLRKVLAPRLAQLRPKAVLQDLWMHVRLKHPTGAAAIPYNLLQKLSYIVVIFVLIPMMIVTGVTMSNSVVAIFHWLPDLFGGRQTARTVHFICAFLLFLFFVVHIFQVIVAGFGREMRSILTGYYVLPKEKRGAN